MAKLSPSKLWGAVLGVWGVLLTGAFATVVGSPGVVQALRLGSLLHSKEDQVARLQDDLKRLQGEASLLERSKVIQQREIRRVLGYAAAEEIIFDFTTADPL